ncbi:MAG: metalloregulator ArsR/SmtB family transcription factor [Firmicutes bacterium]|nr:metalloregulator ArsR/SmtB family transcription factor [Bacillota bacterium]
MELEEDSWLECVTGLGDRHRCRIVALLAQGERCVNDITQSLDLRQNTASHHLKVLRDLGIVTARRDGHDQRWVYYRLNEDRLRVLADVFNEFYESAKTPRFISEVAE